MKNQNQIFAAFQNRASFFAAEFTRGTSTPRGMLNSDVKFILKHAHEGACEFVKGAIDPAIVQKMTNIKAVKRLAQAVAFCAGDSVGGYDKATALIIASIALSKQKTIDFKTMRFTMGGIGDENTAHIKGVSRARLSRFLGTISNEGTRVSQCSRTVGTGGFLSALGAVITAGKTAFSIENPEIPLLTCYAMRLESMGDATFALLNSEE